MLYRVYSESNASDEIKWKLSLVQKNVFYQIFPHGYCRSERAFQIASTPAGSQGRTCLWWWDAWPPPRSSSSFPNSPCGQKAVDFFWETGNRLSGTDQAKKGHFRGPRPRRRPTKCALWRRCGQQIYSLLANFLTWPRSSCWMEKIVLTEAWWAWARSFTVEWASFSTRWRRQWQQDPEPP